MATNDEKRSHEVALRLAEMNKRIQRRHKRFHAAAIGTGRLLRRGTLRKC